MSVAERGWLVAAIERRCHWQQRFAAWTATTTTANDEVGRTHRKLLTNPPFDNEGSENAYVAYAQSSRPFLRYIGYAQSDGVGCRRRLPHKLKKFLSEIPSRRIACRREGISCYTRLLALRSCMSLGITRTPLGISRGRPRGHKLDSGDKDTTGANDTVGTIKQLDRDDLTPLLVLPSRLLDISHHARCERCVPLMRAPDA
ncbi:hypothetical protein SCHPADRAFT_928405 [Schizopora paradoxa]|uniref:Uncharacterized protein n=1 Tax=Schizopora paradoxa TaxID=27342 RepID=A0A0H2RNW6_9AGAM|nr:hypothetical protein SCHPADRAFT_928405 [Schizopora paradoxa]